MSPEIKNQVVPDTKENLEKCLCSECLTNPEEGLYCARGITSKPVDQVRALGCNCALCPVFHEHKLTESCYLCLQQSKTTE